MVETLPRYDLLAERLCNRGDHQFFDAHFWQALGGDPHS